MKRNFKKVEDFKNLPVAKETNKTIVEFNNSDLEILENDFQLENLKGGICPNDETQTTNNECKITPNTFICITL